MKNKHRERFSPRQAPRANKAVSIFGAFCLIAVVAMVVGALTVKHWLTDPPLPSVETMGKGAPLVTTKVYGRDSTTIIGQIYKERRTIVKANEIGQLIPICFLAAEDKNFFRHHGLDFVGLVRALVYNITHPGRRSRGGSTITQQVVKGYVGSEQTIKRKVREAYLAYRLEQLLSKLELILFYLNQIYLGKGNYGVEEAAKYYFGKSAKDVTLAEAAMLAALPKEPGKYPNDLKGWKTRQQFILDAVTKLDWDEKDLPQNIRAAVPAAKAEVIKLVKHDDEAGSFNGEAPEFMDIAEKELTEAVGKGKVNLVGTEVVTSCDLSLQKISRKALRSGLEHIDKNNDSKTISRPRPEGAVIAIDPATRDVVAMIGSYNYSRGNSNWALKAARQAGSTMKVVDLTAGVISNQVTLASMYEDKVATYARVKKANGKEYVYKDIIDLLPGEEIADPNPWTPSNSHTPTGEMVTLRTALARSYNTVYARLGAAKLGVDVIKGTAEQLGSTSKLPSNPAIVLGTADMTPIELTNMYTTLVAEGQRATPRFILKIGSENRGPSEPVQAISPAEAYVVVSAMQSVIEMPDGTGARAQGKLNGWPAAGKTGTTQENRNAWFIGCTPDLCLGVWVGYENNAPMGSAWDGARAALPIWIQIMQEYHKGRPPQQFKRPASGLYEFNGEVYLDETGPFPGGSSTIPTTPPDGMPNVAPSTPPPATTPQPAQPSNPSPAPKEEDEEE